jgi:SAM-dependent methyltransferase
MREQKAPVIEQFYPEYHFGGFTHIDTTVEFYSRIAALLQNADKVLDFGAGRGSNILLDSSPYRRQLKMLRGRCAQLEGCDVDPIVLSNPFLDSARVIEPLQPLPYEDNFFDLIVADWVFEHIQDPEPVVAELLRVVRPGGHICARTVNKWSYISIASRIARNSNHVRLLSRAQPQRLERDVFPTAYRMNSVSTLTRIFAPSSITVYRPPCEPSYYFGRTSLFFALKTLHGILLPQFRPTLLIFVEKYTNGIRSS